jgi:hypothetical protein
LFVADDDELAREVDCCCGQLLSSEARGREARRSGRCFKDSTFAGGSAAAEHAFFDCSAGDGVFSELLRSARRCAASFSDRKARNKSSTRLVICYLLGFFAFSVSVRSLEFEKASVCREETNGNTKLNASKLSFRAKESVFFGIREKILRREELMKILWLTSLFVRSCLLIIVFF